MSTASNFDRVTIIVLDGVGIGEMPDAADWGDAGSDTIGHILETRALRLPNLETYGLGNVRPLAGIKRVPNPKASYGRCALRSNGKDTTTGHWEIAGIVLERAFPTYPSGFPRELIDRFITETGVPGVLGNVAASGTEIIKEQGLEHVESGKPIVYTSADSVFQIAAHEDVIPLSELYRICEIARSLLSGENEVGRVIARPFAGERGAFRRTENRHDYAVSPPTPNLLSALAAAGHDVVCIGKIASIYNGVGVTEDLTAKNNEQAMSQTVNALKGKTRGLIFSNLVDFDMLFGHRRDADGFAVALEHFDNRLPEIEAAMTSNDLLIITADHGNDPTYKGTDHTREYAPLLVYGKRARSGANLGTRDSLADIGQTVARNFGLNLTAGTSFLESLAGDGH